MTKIIFIGDIHIKFTNLFEVDKVQEEILKYCEHNKPSYFILAGDVLDKHERIEVQLLNKAYEFIKSLRSVAPIYVIVGNHDYINNQQFLTENHWMNGMKEWKNVTIVDKPVIINDSCQKFLLIPYVPAGRFLEAIEKSCINLKDVTCVFAHQEIKGCNMGAIISQNGDEWKETWPMLISGHIHERQYIGKNVLYPGSVINHAFSTDNQGVSEFKFKSNALVHEHRIDVHLEKKKILYRNIKDDDILQNALQLTKNHKLSLRGEMKDIASFKKTKVYEDLKKKGIKVVFQKNSVDVHEPIRTGCVFTSVLSDLIKKENDLELEKDYREVVM